MPFHCPSKNEKLPRIMTCPGQPILDRSLGSFRALITITCKCPVDCVTTVNGISQHNFAHRGNRLRVSWTSVCTPKVLLNKPFALLIISTENRNPCILKDELRGLAEGHTSYRYPAEQRQSMSVSTPHVTFAAGSHREALATSASLLGVFYFSPLGCIFVNV